MTNIPQTSKIGVVLLLVSVACLGVSAESIHGVVLNRTSGRNAQGDQVMLLSADNPNREMARTQVDGDGLFTFAVPSGAKQYLVRVIHQGVSYQQPVPANRQLSMEVFDSSAKVTSVTGNIEILRVGVNGSLLHVSDMIEVENDSRPPRTQAGFRTFEVFLPGQSVITSVLAASPGGSATHISATPVAGDSGHWAVNFPLKPGATHFAFNYDLPFEARVQFHPQNLYPTKQLAVMIPPSMKFVSKGGSFQPVAAGNPRYQVEAAVKVAAGNGPAFEIVNDAAPTSAQSHSPIVGKGDTMVTSTTPSKVQASAAGGPTVGLTTSLTRSQWWLLAATTLAMLTVWAGLLWRRQRIFTNSKSRPGSTGNIVMLKHEMFQLEVDRLQGSISMEEYASAKQALEGSMEQMSQARAVNE